MPLTRANCETILIRRLGKLLDAAELDGATVDGTNADLNDPLGYAIRQCGGTVAVADADVTTVADSDVDKLIDLAELRTLENVEGNLDVVDYNVGPRIERLGQLGERVQKALARKRAYVQAAYGLGASTITAGVITQAFAEQVATSEE